MSRVACLPMYDLPELRGATDALWEAIREALIDEGFRDAPPRLERARPPLEALSDPALLLGQTCGYPLMTRLRGVVRVVATPRYRAEGCDGARYRSRVVVGPAVRARTIAELEGLRAARNETGSHSGDNALRACVAPHARGGRFFAEVLDTGSHRASLTALRDGRAEVAAIDCVTWALIADVAPAELDGLRAIGFTEPAPALPFVTAAHDADRTLPVLRRVLDRVLGGPEPREVLDRLRLSGAEASSEQSYAPILRMRDDAAAAGYSELG